MKYGRDDALFVKRKFLNQLIQTTRYNEDEIKNLMTMYTAFAKPGKGMAIRQFDKFWT